MSTFAVVVIGADGATDLIGPFRSEPRASAVAASIANFDEGISADVYLMDSPKHASDYAAGGEFAPPARRETR
jgi:hypothetical protein